MGGCGGDRHPDHAAASEIAKKAVYLSKLDCEFYFYEGGIGKTSQFDPDIYVDITDVMKKKLDLIRCHVCQNVDDRLAKNAMLFGNFRARQTSIDKNRYAEGFKTIFPTNNRTNSILMQLD